MGGYGFTYLGQLLEELGQQSFQDVDIVISDQSNDNNVLSVCEKYSKILDIKYFKNEHGRGKAACNINKAMEHATGHIIKILYQDDYFVCKSALQIINDTFDQGASWVINAFTHSDNEKKSFFNTRLSQYSDNVLLGENTVGIPSNYSILNSEKIYMDENIMYVVDCEFYYRTKQKLGLPWVIREVLVCARHHPVSAVDKPEFYNLKDSEIQYCINKHNINT